MPLSVGAISIAKVTTRAVDLETLLRHKRDYTMVSCFQARTGILVLLFRFGLF